MGRPSKSTGEVPVRERIKQAFWELYKERPIEQICVKEVCAGAGCNKTTFYYHFANAQQALEEIEHECLLVEFPSFIVSLLTEDELDLAAIEDFVHAREDKITTIRILLGPSGDPTFRHLLEDEIVKQWCSAMGIERSLLDDDDRLFLRYSIGGMASLYAMSPREEDEPLDYVAAFKLATECVLPRVKRMIEKYVD